MTRRHKPEHFHIIKLARRYDRTTDTFTYNIAYETATTPTPRTQQVAEAFGLGTDQTQKFTIYDNTQIRIRPTDIVLITGESGSGKSVLLKAIKKDLQTEATDLNNIQPEPNTPIIDTLAKTFQEALELLSKAGLNDAFLFTRTYAQLSDGQKYRYRLAKLAETPAQWWIADEFCSNLDRDTAKIVAFNLQKLARQQHKAAILATTHNDLFKDLNPNAHIHKHYGKQIAITYRHNKPPTQCTLTKQMRIEQGTINDYKQLAPFHYRTSTCPPPRRIFTLKRKHELTGVIVYSHPPPTMFGRNKTWKGTFQQLQQQMSTITRVIIHPKYRTISLGTKLVKETLNKAGTPHVETLAVMAKYNPFFEKAGMTKIAETTPNKHVTNTIEKLRQIGFNPQLLGNQTYNTQTLKTTEKSKIINILEELSLKDAALRKRIMSLADVYPTHERFMHRISTLTDDELATVLRRLSFLAQTKVYLHWQQPKQKTLTRHQHLTANTTS